MIDVPLPNDSKHPLEDVGEWLELNLPNPPLPEEQRWTIAMNLAQTRYGVRFLNDHDAIMFTLRWG